MNKKRKLLNITIVLFVVLSLSLSIGHTLAFWSEVSGDSITTTETVNTGEWNQAFTYDANTSYQVGDLVTNNGSTYEAKKSGLLREPGVDNGWKSDWNQL